MKTPEEIKEILDKMQFFGGQRAGRELWMDKPKDIQDADIESFNKDINNIRSYIQQLKRERDAAIEHLKYYNCRTCVRGKLMRMASECCDCKNASRWEWRGVK